MRKLFPPALGTVASGTEGFSLLRLQRIDNPKNSNKKPLPQDGGQGYLFPLPPAQDGECEGSVRIFWLPLRSTFRAFPEASLQWLCCGFRPRSQLRGSDGVTPSSPRRPYSGDTMSLTFSHTRSRQFLSRRSREPCKRSVCNRLRQDRDSTKNQSAVETRSRGQGKDSRRTHDVFGALASGFISMSSREFLLSENALSK
jgi:hypothetical protein